MPLGARDGISPSLLCMNVPSAVWSVMDMGCALEKRRCFSVAVMSSGGRVMFGDVLRKSVFRIEWCFLTFVRKGTCGFQVVDTLKA